MSAPLNAVVNYEIVTTDNLTLFKEKIYPLMNITVVNPHTTIASGSNGQTLPQSTIYVTSTANFATSGSLAVGTGHETVTYTGISGNSFTGCTGGTAILSTGGPVDQPVGDTWLVFPNDAPFEATIINNQYSMNTIYPILASAFGSNASLDDAVATIILPSSNEQVLGGYSIYTTSSSGFSSEGGAAIIGSDYIQYTGINGNILTGCTGGSGTLYTSEAVYGIPIALVSVDSNGQQPAYLTTLYVSDTTGFPTSGALYIDIGGVIAVATYTGITSTTFTGFSCLNYSTLATGNTVTQIKANLILSNELPKSTIQVNAVTNFPSSGNLYAVNNAGEAQVLSYTSTTTNNTTVSSFSNGVQLPYATIAVASVSGFPSSGYIIVASTSGPQIVHYTGTSSASPNTFTGCTGGSGYIYTGYAITAEFFTGCTGGTGFIDSVGLYNSLNSTAIDSGSNGQVLGGYTLNVSSTSGFPPSGTIIVNSTAGAESVNYTGITGTSFTGCTGGTGTIFATSNGAVLPQSSIFVNSTANFLSSGTLLVSDTNGTESVTYTGVTPNSFTGCSGGTGTLATGDLISITGTTVASSSNGLVLGTGKNTVNVVSTTGFVTSGSALNTRTGQISSYTGVTSTTFDGCTGYGILTTGDIVFADFPSTYSITQGINIATGSNGQTLPQLTIYANSTAGFTNSGKIAIYTTAGQVIVTYTSITGGSTPSFNACSGGSGTMTTGGGIFQVLAFPLVGTTFEVNSTAGFPPQGVLFFPQTIYYSENSITYTGITPTSFTGCTSYGSAPGQVITGDYIYPWNGYQPFYIFETGTGSYSAALPQSTIYYNISGAPPSGVPVPGYFIIQSDAGYQQINYTGYTSSSTYTFTGCTGGTGNLPTYPVSIIFANATSITSASNGENLEGDNIFVVSTSGFPSSGTILVTDSNGVEVLAYNNTTATSFNGCTLVNTTTYGSGQFLTSGSPYTLYVTSTFNFPTSGVINVYTTFNSYTAVTYTGITATSFTGCTNSINAYANPGANVYFQATGTLSTSDPVNIYPATMTAASIIDSDYATVLTGASKVTNTTEQPYVIIGNTSNNDGNQNVDAAISSTSIGFNAIGTVPDTNNGNIIWALTDDVSTTYKSIVPVSGDVANRVQYFISDGNKVRVTQNTQTYWTTVNIGPSNGFTPINISGNLLAYVFTTGSLTANFSIGNNSGVPFSTVIENDTAYSLDFGYTTNGVTFSTNSFTIAPNSAVFVFGDGINVFTTPTTPSATTPILVNNGNNYTISTDPSHTTYLINNSSGSCTVYLPNSPVDGMTFTFKDQDNTFNLYYPFTINGNGYYIKDQTITQSALSYTTSNLSITLQYFATDSYWRVINKTDKELSPIWITSNYNQPDFREEDNYVDTSYQGSPVNFYFIDYYYTPIDGEVFTIKDATQIAAGGNWGNNPVILNSQNQVEYPVGTINPASLPITANVSGSYLKWRYDATSSIWLLIGIK